MNHVVSNPQDFNLSSKRY